MIIYLDNGATTKQYDQVTAEMMDMIAECYGNPSSLHSMGLKAFKRVEKARKKVANSLGIGPEGVYFTGSGTEANNLAITGGYRMGMRKGNKIITSKGEHSAVIETCKSLEAAYGAQVVYLEIDRWGNPNLDELKSNLDESTVLVSIMSVNNELGTINPIEEIGSLVKTKCDGIFHTDAIQAYGKIPIDLDKSMVDLLSISGHKVHGPKGVGALYVRKGLHMDPLIYGGGQERGLRSGSENTPGIVGLGQAATIMGQAFAERVEAMTRIKDYLLKGIIAEIPDIRVNSPETASPGILNISFLACPGQVLLRTLEQENIYVSTGAACSSKKSGSRILTAMGLPKDVTESAIRFSFSEFNSIEEIDFVLVKLKKAVSSIRRLTGKK